MVSKGKCIPGAINMQTRIVRPCSIVTVTNTVKNVINELPRVVITDSGRARVNDCVPTCAEVNTWIIDKK